MKETELEYVLTHSYKENMISYLKKNPLCFEEAVELSVSDNQPYAWRAAWLLWSCIETNDPKIVRHVDKILNCISKKQDGHQRELIKILLEMELSDRQEGILFDICVSLWEQIGKKPSVRFTAFKFINKLVKKYPDLRNELLMLTQSHYLDSLSPGVNRSITKMIKSI